MNVIKVVVVCFMLSWIFAGNASSNEEKAYFLYDQIRQGAEAWDAVDELSLIGQAEIMTADRPEDVYSKIASSLQNEPDHWQYEVRLQVLSQHENKAKMGLTIETKYARIPEAESFLQQRAKIYYIFQDLGASPRLTTCLLGHLNGKLNKDDSEQLLSQGLRSLGARGQEVYWDGRCASASAYLPGLPESKLVGGVLVNIHTALRYHSQDDKTYVALASPVILREY